MKTQKSGVVLVVSSIFASRPPRMNALYSGTKAFAEAITKGFAVEHAAHGIRANVIAPGPTATDMNNVTMSVSPEALARTTGFGRLANPDEIAAAALFLCSDEASYISGQVLNVDGIAQG